MTKIKQYWNWLSTLGIRPEYSEEESIRFTFMNRCFGFGMLTILFMAPMIQFLVPAATVMTVGVAIILCCCLRLSAVGRHELAWHICAISVLTALTLSPLMSSPCHGNYLYFANLLVMTVFFFENKRVVYFYLGITLVGTFIFTYLNLTYAAANLRYPLLLNLCIVGSNVVLSIMVLQLYIRGKTRAIRKFDYAASLAEAALEATPNGLIIIDPTGKIIHYNGRLISMWNIPTTIIQQRKLDVLLGFLAEQLEEPERLLDQQEQFLNENLWEGQSAEIALRNGRIFKYYSHPQVLHDQIVGRVISFRDRSAEHQAQKEIAERELRLRAIFNHCPIGMVVGRDQSMSRKNMNRQFSDMLGYTPEELEQMTVEDITYPEDRKLRPQFLDQQRAEGINHVKVRKRYVKRSGDLLWANVNIGLVKDEAGNIKEHIVMVEDISTQMEQEEEIKRLLAELQQHNEALEVEVKNRTVDLRSTNEELRRSNEDLEQFAYVASHDLQEPLRMVGNFVQLLERQYRDQIDEEGLNYIHFAVDGVKRMSHLIQNLLKYSRVGRGDIRLQATNINELVKLRLLDLEQKVKETNTDLKLEHLPDQVWCEDSQIGIVFYNLVTNALKFNQSSRPRIRIGGTEEADCWRFYVADNGIGIEPQFQTKIFEIFRRLNHREDYEGTGIGLALCKKIVSRHQGKIWFESEPNNGTTFYFTIKKGLRHELSLPSYSDTAS
ncbi:MAG: ATP-binding protein [Bacteroidota bacterium]